MEHDAKSIDAGNWELLGDANAELATTVRRPRRDEDISRVLVVIHPEGYVEAFAYNGARVLVTERWADQAEDEWERTLTMRWRELWRSMTQTDVATGFPKGDASWKQRAVQLAELDFLKELGRSTRKGATLDMLRQAGRQLGLGETDADDRAREVYAAMREAKELQ